jgi:hypothetical protein
VSALIWLVLGRREATVVLIAIPVTLALTLFVFYLYGYTLNRITLFALIFSIGILVDDAIVVVENIARHARMSPDRSRLEAIAIRAVDEVGNPTILATLTVVAAILPMAFVGGLMGPYMRPIPVGATAAMVFSLAVAFIVTPWAAVRLLGRTAGHHDDREDRLTVLYRRVMGHFIGAARARWLFLGAPGDVCRRDGPRAAGLVIEDAPFDNRASGRRPSARRRASGGTAHGAGPGRRSAADVVPRRRAMRAPRRNQRARASLISCAAADQGDLQIQLRRRANIQPPRRQALCVRDSRRAADPGRRARRLALQTSGRSTDRIRPNARGSPAR